MAYKYDHWQSDMKSVWMTDDIAFVGGTPVSMHILKCDDGLILLDSGYPGMDEGLEANMEALGLHVDDIRYILHSHGHIDHFGSTVKLVRRTGAKTLIGEEDADVVRGLSDLSWAKESGIGNPFYFEPDQLFRDGDVITLGGRAIRCVHVPGHTMGTYAFFTATTVNGKPLVAAMHGGVGLNTLSKKYLTEIGRPLSIRDTYKASLHKVAGEHVDVVLGNHPSQAAMPRKLEAVERGEYPFVDETEWARLMETMEKKLDDLIASEAVEN